VWGLLVSSGSEALADQDDHKKKEGLRGRKGKGGHSRSELIREEKRRGEVPLSFM